MSTKKSLLDAYRFPGFCPRTHITGIFGDPKARVIRLVRREKKRRAADAELRTGVSTIVRSDGFATCRAGRCASFWKWRSAEFGVDGVAR